jgi:hypothetical protein
MPELPEDDALEHWNMYEIFRYNRIKYIVQFWLYVANICKMDNTHFFNVSLFVSFGCFQSDIPCLRLNKLKISP